VKVKFMSKITFLTRSDCHISDRVPASRIDDYRAAILDKLDQTYQIATAHSCLAILDAGDFFHTKKPMWNSHDLVSQVATQHHQYEVPVWTVIGNHDMSFTDVSGVDKQPLGVLFNTGTFQYLVDVSFVEFDLKVRVVGVDYRIDPTEVLKAITKGTEDLLIGVFHGCAGNESMPGREKWFSFQELANFAPDLWVCGHIHKDYGIVRIGTKQIISLGSVARGALTEDNVDRTPRIGLISINKDANGVTCDVEAVPLTVRPASAVFNFEKKVRIAAEHKKIDDFITNFANVSAEGQELKLKEAIEKMEMAQEVKDTIFRYIIEAENAKSA
jgi:DNA repair exonuclease SbcCD nuclease subunit